MKVVASLEFEVGSSSKDDVRSMVKFLRRMAYSVDGNHFVVRVESDATVVHQEHARHIDEDRTLPAFVIDVNGIDVPQGEVL